MNPSMQVYRYADWHLEAVAYCVMHSLSILVHEDRLSQSIPANAGKFVERRNHNHQSMIERDFLPSQFQHHEEERNSMELEKDYRWLSLLIDGDPNDSYPGNFSRWPLNFDCRIVPDSFPDLTDWPVHHRMASPTRRGPKFQREREIVERNPPMIRCKQENSGWTVLRQLPNQWESLDYLHLWRFQRWLILLQRVDPHCLSINYSIVNKRFHRTNDSDHHGSKIVVQCQNLYRHENVCERTLIDTKQFRIVRPAAIRIGNDADLYKVHNCCKPLWSMIILKMDSSLATLIVDAHENDSLGRLWIFGTLFQDR